jgi:hypothetical protein
MKNYTIYDIKRLTEETAPYYFSRKTMKFFGQTLKDFKTYKQEDGRILISAPLLMNGKKISTSERYFNPNTNQLENK